MLINKLLNYININTIKSMILMYCKDHHNTEIESGQSICKSCLILEIYALNKLEKCPYGNNKPNCPKCPVHCYSEEMRERISVIMRYAGPRMAFRHPILAVYHIFNNARKVTWPGKSL